MESLPEIDVVNSSPSELLASPLNITFQQNVNEDNISSSQIQEPMETIPVEQIDHINAKSQKRNYPDITADKPFMESGACPPFIKPSKQDEDRDCDLFPILSSRQFTFQSHSEVHRKSQQHSHIAHHQLFGPIDRRPSTPKKLQLQQKSNTIPH